MEYQLSPHKNNESTLAVLHGIINEDSEVPLQHIKNDIKDIKKVTFNFAKVTAINSLGVRAWVQFLRSVEEGREIIFEECSADVIMQINMIPNFSGKSYIASFYTNYICDSCSGQQKILIDRQALPPKGIPDKPQCPACNEAMETEELEEEFFAFLTR